MEDGHGSNGEVQVSDLLTDPVLAGFPAGRIPARHPELFLKRQGDARGEPGIFSNTDPSPPAKGQI